MSKQGIAKIALAILASGFIGCTSISSTFLHRHDNDEMVGVSNGTPGIHDHARPFKGIPITLKIPTHLDVAIQETLFFVETPGKGDLKQVSLSRRHLDVAPAIQYSDKIFTVDLKRPASGALDYEIEFQDGKNAQYFNKVSYHVVDETIKDITAIISSLPAKNVAAGKTKSSDNAPPGTTVTPKVSNQTRTVAWKRFDLNSTDFEAQVLLFVNTHLNDCNSCELNQAGCKHEAIADGPTYYNPNNGQSH